MTTDSTTTTTYPSETGPTQNSSYFETETNQLCKSAALQFEKIQHFYLKFHGLFTAGFFLELLLFMTIFHYFPKSSVLALFISLIFLTLFSYLILHSYFQVKKPEQLCRLRDHFLHSVKTLASSQKESSPFLLTFALRRLIAHLSITEKSGAKLEIFPELFFKWRIWTGWRDLLKMKELLLFSSIEEHFHVIRDEPTDGETHASLVDLYRYLSKLYIDPKKLTMNESLIWMPKSFYRDEMVKIANSYLEKAIQELLILVDYTPDDLWARAQLASIYSELKLVENEIAEYETILTIAPEEKEILFRLGVLYFKQGKNGKALKIYDKFKKLHPSKAHELIAHYGIQD